MRRLKSQKKIERVEKPEKIQVEKQDKLSGERPPPSKKARKAGGA